MKNKIILLILSGLLMNLELTAQIKLVPQPSSLKVKDGSVTLSSIHCFASETCKAEAWYLMERFRTDFGISFGLSGNNKKTNLYLTVSDKKLLSLGTEGYELSISPSGIKIDAASPTGVFYGIQSLLQIITEDENNLILAPCLEITDKPRFPWRGFMLDEARRFKGPEVVKQMLDEMAAMKMNVFHWHLTDDQGWRIAIKKYPKLTEIGSVRTGSKVSPADKSDGIAHSGYYTREEIREIVAYAASRHIKVVPEIEMPGHASAAIASYPWLGTENKQIEIPEALLVVCPDIFNVADKKVRSFFKDVIDEICALFPSGIVHIGGDEVKYDQWKNSAFVNTFMKEQNLQSAADLQLWFTNEMSAYISGKDRRMMGWNDIVGDKIHEYNDSEDIKMGRILAKNTIVQFWKGDPKLIEETVKKGYEIVNSYHIFTYLDYTYESIDLRKAYGFDPVPESLGEEYQDKILGLGCQMWSQAIPTRESMHKQVFPRIAAYAETGWTQKENKNYDRFIANLQALTKAWDKRGISYDEENLK